MNSALILTGGSGSRFGSDKCKATLAGKPVFLHCLDTFQNHPEISEIVIVAKKDEISEYEGLKPQYPKIKTVVEGGAERQDSVRNGMQQISGEITLIHNGANPLVTAKEISDTIEATAKYGSAVVGHKATNTLKQVDTKGFIQKTIPRHDIFEVQTPQGVNTQKFKELIKNPDKTLFTDDVSFFEQAGLQTKIVPCSQQNFKITYPEDLTKAESLLNTKLKIGFGHDSHRFLEKSNINQHSTGISKGKTEPILGFKKLQETLAKFLGLSNPSQNNAQAVLTRPFLHTFFGWKKKSMSPKAKNLDIKKQFITLGGIKVPNTKTFDANSDGDVVIHAICNAIGTAIGQGSLSLYADQMCKDGITDSKKYLKYIFSKAQNLGYEIGNITCSIEALEPKLEKHIPAMKEIIAKTLNCTPLQIGIACTSGEKLSDFGKGLGIQCFVNIILTKFDKSK